MDMILNAVEVFFLFLAECVYDIASLIYGLIIAISESNYFSQEVIQKFASRVYVLLGIFMLFKVSFSLINYIVNPDDFTDKQKGVGKLVPNIMITLVLIVFTPRIFAELTDLQHLITGQHFFERIIFGQTYNETVAGDVGDMMSLNLFNAFYYYDAANLPEDAKDITECTNGTCRYDSYYDAFNTYSPYNAYSGIWSGKAEYHELLSLLAAIVLALVLIQFCFDIAIRTIKFGFLQLIAPVPIVSRIDPKSAKDGMFAKWVKLCSKTYLDLFMRLIALYFAIALIAIIYDPANETQINANMIGFDAFLVKAFLMIGVLMFAKQLPKMLEDLFGFKLDGGFTLNPIKRIEKDAAGGKFITGAVGGLAQGAIGAATHAGVGSIVTGTLGGAFRNKGFADAWSKGKASNKNMRTAILNGSTFGGRMQTRLENFLGTGGEEARIEQEKDVYQKQLDNLKEQKDTVESKIASTRQSISEHNSYADSIKELEKRAKDQIENGAAGEISIKYYEMQAVYERLLREGASAEYKYKDKDGNEQIAKGDKAAAAAKQVMNDYLNNGGVYEYMTKASYDKNMDKTFSNLYATAEQKGRELGLLNENGLEGLLKDGDSADLLGERIHGALGAEKGTIGELQRSIYTDERRISSIDTEIKEINEEVHEKFAKREKESKANQDAIK